MITVRQTQRKISFSKKLFAQKAAFVLQFLDYADFDLGIWLTTNKTIHQYNKDFRGKDKPTDVLSFPYHPTLQAGKRIKVVTPDDKNIGDLIISVEYVLKNDLQLAGDFIERMDRMLVHGICHLLGYDHIQDNDYKKMITLERKILKALSYHFKK